MTKDEALKLALVTLERTGNIAGFAHEREQAAITAIRETLAQPEQEPVGQVGEDKHGLVGDIYDDRKVKIGDKLYTSLPQRQWVGLTNNELQPIADEYRILFGSWVEDFARAIEAKLKEKNT